MDQERRERLIDNLNSDTPDTGQLIGDVGLAIAELQRAHQIEWINKHGIGAFLDENEVAQEYGIVSVGRAVDVLRKCGGLFRGMSREEACAEAEGWLRHDQWQFDVPLLTEAGGLTLEGLVHLAVRHFVEGAAAAGRGSTE